MAYSHVERYPKFDPWSVEPPLRFLDPAIPSISPQYLESLLRYRPSEAYQSVMNYDLTLREEVEARFRQDDMRDTNPPNYIQPPNLQQYQSNLENAVCLDVLGDLHEMNLVLKILDRGELRVLKLVIQSIEPFHQSV